MNKTFTEVPDIRTDIPAVAGVSIVEFRCHSIGIKKKA